MTDVSLTIASYEMLFQIKMLFFCEHVQMEALSPASFNIKVPDRDREEREERGRKEEGTGGSCWVSADGLTQFQGTQWSQRLISKRQIVILSSMAPVWWVHPLCGGRTQGRRPGPEERATLWRGPGWEGNWKWNCLKCVWNALKWKSAQLLRLPLESIQKGTQLVLTRLSGWTGGGRVNRPRQWCCCLGDGPRTPIPRNSAASPLNPNHSPHIPAEKNTRAPILHFYYFSIFQTVGVPSAAAQPPPPPAPHPFHPVLQLQSCLHRLERQPVWPQLNTSTYTNTQTVPCKQNSTSYPINTHVHPLMVPLYSITWHSQRRVHIHTSVRATHLTLSVYTHLHIHKPSMQQVLAAAVCHLQEETTSCNENESS